MNRRSRTPQAITLPSSTGSSSITVLMYRCKMTLGELQDTERSDVKFCTQCLTTVFRATDAEGIQRLVSAGRCTWIESSVTTAKPTIGLVCSDDEDFEADLLSEIEAETPQILPNDKIGGRK